MKNVNNIKCSLVLLLWLAIFVPLALAESFPNRPTTAELDSIVDLGTECIRGLNERCWATQYSTNPVQYRVAPFTNNAQWYLDKNLLGSMAAKIRALVPWYANTNTIYDGTTNISMLTVTGVWAQLQIGNHTNKFTATPASGTNAATYGDDPWRIYKEGLEERYKVLETNRISRASLNYDLNPVRIRTATSNTYAGMVTIWNNESYWTISGGNISFGVRIDRNASGTAWGFQRAAFIASNLYFIVSSNLSINSAKLFGETILPFGSMGISISSYKYYDADFFPSVQHPHTAFLTNFPAGANFMPVFEYGFKESIFAASVAEPATAKGMNMLGGSIKAYVLWYFQYCTGE